MSTSIHSHIETLVNNTWISAEPKRYTNHTYTNDLALLGETYCNPTSNSPLHFNDPPTWELLDALVDSLDSTRYDSSKDSIPSHGQRWITLAELASAPALPAYIKTTISEITSHYPTTALTALRISYGYSS